MSGHHKQSTTGERTTLSLVWLLRQEVKFLQKELYISQTPSLLLIDLNNDKTALATAKREYNQGLIQELVAQNVKRSFENSEAYLQATSLKNELKALRASQAHLKEVFLELKEVFYGEDVLEDCLKKLEELIHKGISLTHE